MKRLLLAIALSSCVVLVMLACGRRGHETVYDTAPEAKPVTVTVDATSYFEVVTSEMAKSGDGYLGKATLKAKVDINTEEVVLAYKGCVWT